MTASTRTWLHHETYFITVWRIGQGWQNGWGWEVRHATPLGNSLIGATHIVGGLVDYGTAPFRILAKAAARNAAERR